MIFARRSIERFLNHLAGVISDAGHEKLVRELNRNELPSLDFEWEVAILYALAQLGSISYERNYGGTANPDVAFCLPGSDDIAFVADIAAVSDRGLEEENPSDLLWQLVLEEARRLKLGGGFTFQISGAVVDRKPKLSIPSRSKLPAFFHQHIKPTLRQIASEGRALGEISLNDGDHRLTITYDADARASVGNHLSYTAVYSLTRNPIHTSLKLKAGQLRKSGFDGCRGIILCDAGCTLLRSYRRSPRTYSCDQVIESFLRQNKSISFVLTVWVEQVPRKPQILYTKLIQNRSARVAIGSAVEAALLRLPDVLPAPVMDGRNAILRIEEGRFGNGQSFFGSYHMGGGQESLEIKVSARALLDLLAGRLDPKQFAERHGFTSTGNIKEDANPFELALARGHLIRAVSLERVPDKDDDWLAIKLSGPDVAISPFRRHSGQ